MSPLRHPLLPPPPQLLTFIIQELWYSSLLCDPSNILQQFFSSFLQHIFERHSFWNTFILDFCMTSNLYSLRTESWILTTRWVYHISPSYSISSNTPWEHLLYGLSGGYLKQYQRQLTSNFHWMWRSPFHCYLANCQWLCYLTSFHCNFMEPFCLQHWAVTCSKDLMKYSLVVSEWFLRSRFAQQPAPSLVQTQD